VPQTSPLKSNAIEGLNKAILGATKIKPYFTDKNEFFAICAINPHKRALLSFVKILTSCCFEAKFS